MMLRTYRLLPVIGVVLLAASTLTFARTSRPAARTGPGVATGPATRPATAPSGRSLSADQMLDQMLRPAPAPGGTSAGRGAGDGTRVLQVPNTPPTEDKTSGPGAVKPNAPAVAVQREGTYVVDRVGRLTRSADGSQAEFTFDSDARALRDPPVIILPSLKLTAMENAVSSANRDLRFRITGMLTEYRGRNYILLEKVVVIPDVAQQF